MEINDLDLKILSVGELLMLEEAIAGELKARQWDRSPANQAPPDKQVARVAFELRSLARSLQNVAREFRPRKEKAKP